MIKFIKLGAFAQIIVISVISSIATLIFKHSGKRITKKNVYTFNVLFNLVLILIENIVLCNWYGNILLIFDIWSIMQIFIYWYGCICVSQLFYDKAKEIFKEFNININLGLIKDWFLKILKTKSISLRKNEDVQ